MEWADRKFLKACMHFGMILMFSFDVQSKWFRLEFPSKCGITSNRMRLSISMNKLMSICMPSQLFFCCSYTFSHLHFRMIERQTLKEGTSKSSLSSEVAKNLKKRDLQKATIIETLKSTLLCDDLDATEIYYHHVNETSELVTAKANIEYLLKVGVSRETIIENGFLLPMPWSMIFPCLLFL